MVIIYINMAVQICAQNGYLGVKIMHTQIRSVEPSAKGEKTTI